MQDRDQLYLDRRERISGSNGNDSREAQNIVTRIPNQTGAAGYLANSPQPDVYRQALRVILETPQIERRLNYITAGMIVTILGSWLSGAVLKSRPFALFTDLLLFFCSLALAGLLVGIMLGEGVMPIETIPVLLFAMLGILIFVVAVMLLTLLLRSPRTKEQSE